MQGWSTELSERGVEELTILARSTRGGTGWSDRVEDGGEDGSREVRKAKYVVGAWGFNAPKRVQNKDNRTRKSTIKE